MLNLTICFYTICSYFLKLSTYNKYLLPPPTETLTYPFLNGATMAYTLEFLMRHLLEFAFFQFLKSATGCVQYGESFSVSAVLA